MKSIQTKFIALILSCVFVCSAVIGGAGILSSKRVVDEDSARLMNYRCSELACEVDATLSRIEQSVKTLAVYTDENLESLDRLKHDDAYLKEFTEKIESVAVNAANNTEGTVAVYVRFNPEFTPPESGLFWSKTNLSGTFQKMVPTDFSRYSPTDLEHVGWYYIPVKNGRAIWMSPYTNENINVQMISYVIPIYKSNETVGVVGMDIDFNVIKDMIKNVRLYESGYAFLTDEKGNVMHHKVYPFGIAMGNVDKSLNSVVAELENGTSGSSLFSYVDENVKKKMAFRTLRNGMRLAVTAPLSEIDKNKNVLLFQIVVSLLVIAPLSVLVTVLMTRRIIRPLKMISYVIPIYKSNETVGVVGMDIDFNVIKDMIKNVRLYESGYAFLTDEKGNVMHHKVYPFGIAMGNVDKSLNSVVAELENGTSGSSLFSYVDENVKKKMAFRTLRNGMRLAVTAPLSEIDKNKNVLLFQIVVSLLVIAPLSVLVTVLMTRRIIRPLKELNEAAKQIANGDLSISLTRQTKDEVGTLAESFQQTVDHLQTYINYINSLAYRDGLTGVKNKAAYQEAERRLEEKMRSGHAEFAVVVLDIDNLKWINDYYGHDFGDMFIVDACRLICKSFPHSPVYRIGGDEFAVILEGVDYEKYAQLLEQFNAAVEEYNRSGQKDMQLSIARGIAVYNSDTDLVFSNVFKRADDAMYQNKASMKRMRAAEQPKEK